MICDFAYHNSHKNYYRNPFGAVKVGTKVIIKILSEKDYEVILNVISFSGNLKRIRMKYEGENDNRVLYYGEIDTTEYEGAINYYFELRGKGKNFYYGNNEKSLGGEGKIYYNNPKMYQITVYKENFIPKWYKEGIIYQIFVDRFYNGNDDKKVNNPKKNSFIYGNWSDEPMYIKDMRGNIIRWDFYGGNLRGIIKKLSYLKELGITIIYLNPIFESSSCHKYDTGDYEKIDSMFGTEEDFKELCSEARKNGIRIILDGVFSHTGVDSKYFNKYSNYEEVGAYQSRKSKYYNWYRFYKYPNEYDCWWGIDNQPNVNELNESYLKYIVTGENSIVSKWIKAGASGWRLDVADELPDEFIRLLKKRIREENKDSILIGEVWEDASNKVSYSEKRRYLFGEELDSVTNYSLRNIIVNLVNEKIGIRDFIDVIMSLYENYPKENFYSNMNLLGNHDTERIFTIFNEDKYKLEIAIAIIMTLPGVPLIYYGDEVGITGGKDPENRKTFPWGNENSSIRDLYKNMISLRKNNKELISGILEFQALKGDLLIYSRNIESSSVLIIINPYSEARFINLEEKFNKSFKLIAKSRKYIDEVDTSNEIRVRSKSYLILKEI